MAPNVPENITLSIVEAPAEFVVPVKQDRRLAPSFKVRVEVKHRGNLTMPMTLRAHVLTQQDKEGLESWAPADSADLAEDKGQQRAAPELKGTSCIQYKWEFVGGHRTSSSQLDAVIKINGSGAATNGLGLGQGPFGRAPALGHSDPRGGAGTLLSVDPGSGGSSAERLIKHEPSFGMRGAVGGQAGGFGSGVNGGGAGLGFGAKRGLGGAGGGPLDSFGRVDSPGMGHRHVPGHGGMAVRDAGVGAGLLRDMAAAQGLGLSRDLLFAPNRPEPVVTLGSIGRVGSASGSGLSGLAGGAGGGGAALAQSSTVSRGEAREFYDAGVDMIMPPAQQQPQLHFQQPQQQQQRHMPLGGALGMGLGGLDAQQVPFLAAQQQQQRQRQLQQQQQHDGQQLPPMPLLSMAPGGGQSAHESQGPQLPSRDLGGLLAEGGLGGNEPQRELMTARQEFEFTNLEFLKPTRMNKIDDLHERRVDSWIRDYVGATHLLDVYRHKRVDKRKVFASDYTRLRGMEMG
ncbi:hypothetical protein TSOC_007926 [Tetrabaena socialis]|uniref:Uncharacterized protein n=1 Tax=Tetrabaena socialis TaxID=47790 RepID=A0A2J7ZZR1_9CHLO|nr:hypothetical protein TSOC_007926 [Tetrabaena socialis]|eukprot:PNH05767.1 hypothetical protein TSOC_007926 [Tetrabaena socialis]